ncbi:MAG: TolC family protein [Sulfurimonas sp.]
MIKILFVISFSAIIYAHTLPELFDALKHHSQTASDEMVVQKSKINKDLVTSGLYPKINLFASYDNYSTPTGVVPVPPNTLKPMLGNPAIAQPFSENIYRAGANFTMPIFVKSIYTTADKAETMQTSAKAKKHIKMLKNEAVIVSANANFLYLDELSKSFDGKKRSLLQTQRTLQIKVNNGRAAASALYKINDGLNQIDIAKNNIELQKKSIISTIETLTGISLQEPIKMSKALSYESGDFASLRPQREKVRADRLGARAEKEKLYPALFAHGSYAYSRASAYNNDKTVNEEYGNIGLTLNIPLLEMSQYDAIALSEIQVRSSEVELSKTRDELSSQAKMLKESLPLLENSKKLYKQSIEDKKRLLDIAKLNYKNARLSTEEYLRYEDDVVSEEAKLYKTQATEWQTLMQLAVIYANNIEEMVK